MRKNYRFKLLRFKPGMLERQDMCIPMADVATKKRICHSCSESILAGQECFAYLFLDSSRHLQRTNQCVECAKSALVATSTRITQYRTYLRKQYRRAAYLSNKYGIAEKRAAKLL